MAVAVSPYIGYRLNIGRDRLQAGKQVLDDVSGIKTDVGKIKKMSKVSVDEWRQLVEVFERAQQIANRELASDSAEMQRIRGHFYQQSLDSLVIYRVYALKLRDLILQQKNI